MSQPSAPRQRGTTEPPDGEAEGGARPRLEALLAHAPVMAFELDPEGRYTSCGGRPMGEIGLDPAAMLGQQRLDDGGVEGGEACERPGLVLLDNARVAHHICCHDRGQPAVRPGHGTLPSPPGWRAMPLTWVVARPGQA